VSEIDIPALFQRYADTFASRDVAAVVALHAANTLFHQHTGVPPAPGPEGVRSAFGTLFQTWPDLSFEVERTLFGDDFWVLDWTLVANGDGTRLDCLDVVTVDEEGLVVRKDTYVDVPAVR
jgi:ketosteroid isomerase-like protein